MENSNYNNDGRNENSNASSAANYETGNSQSESSSTYSYSYLNQEQKNPNNIWRAEENTASAYSNSAQGAAGNAQPGAGKAYGNTQNSTDSGYASYHYTQPDANDSMYAGMNGAYGSTGSSTYGSTQSGTYGTAQNQAYSTQSADSMGQGTQSAADSGNQGAQPGMDNPYSSIYGSPNGQGGWNTYSDARKQKKEERARKRAEKSAGTHPGFGVKLAKCASIALVFGLVAGTAFEGSSYVAGNLLGTNDKEASIPAEKEEVLGTGDSVQNTAPLTNVSSNAGDGVTSVVEACMPSIVSITNMSRVQYQNWFGQVQNYEVPSAGSGIIVSEDENYLYIVTNNHVVASASSNKAVAATSTLSIQFCDNTTVAAEIKGTDASTDLAVVQVKKSDLEAGTLSEIKVAALGDSDAVKVGSQAIAIGNALGYGQSVTAGYISAVGRDVTMQDEQTNETYTNSLIQTDAAINPGNSGGALLNSSGEVIGINSSKYSDTTVEGMGFAIPSNMAKPIIEDLITREEVTDDRAAYLGISGMNVTASVSSAYNMPEGVFIKEVTKGTAAEKYGIQQGDILTGFDGREIKTMEALQKRLSYYEAGTEVKIVVQRPAEGGYQEKTLSVVLGKKN